MNEKNIDDLIAAIESVDSVSKSITTIDVLLRNGNVVSAYRLGIQTIDLLNCPDYKKIMSRALIRMRKGEQIDALNDVKSLYDLLKNEKRKILKSFTNG